jgi:hypothetical protein
VWAAENAGLLQLGKRFRFALLCSTGEVGERWRSDEISRCDVHRLLGCPSGGDVSGLALLGSGFQPDITRAASGALRLFLNSVCPSSSWTARAFRDTKNHARTNDFVPRLSRLTDRLMLCLGRGVRPRACVDQAQYVHRPPTRRTTRVSYSSRAPSYHASGQTNPNRCYD